MRRSPEVSPSNGTLGCLIWPQIPHLWFKNVCAAPFLVSEEVLFAGDLTHQDHPVWGCLSSQVAFIFRRDEVGTALWSHVCVVVQDAPTTTPHSWPPHHTADPPWLSRDVTVGALGLHADEAYLLVCMDPCCMDETSRPPPTTISDRNELPRGAIWQRYMDTNLQWTATQDARKNLNCLFPDLEWRRHKAMAFPHSQKTVIVLDRGPQCLQSSQQAVEYDVFTKVRS